MAAPRPGCRLTVKRDVDLEPAVKAQLVRLRLSREGSIIYCTYVDSVGMSIYAKRSGLHMSDIEAFIPNGLYSWGSFFEVGGLTAENEVSPQYTTSKHTRGRRFPFECV